MQRLPPRDDQDRFKGTLRLHHRGGPPSHRSWDEWINGKPPGSTGRISKNRWVNILIIAFAVLALGGIIAGLIIELR
jgi:hypothetical protein